MAYVKARRNYRSKPEVIQAERAYGRLHYRTDPVRRATKLASQRIYGHPERKAAAILSLAAKLEFFMNAVEKAMPDTPEVRKLRSGLRHLTADQLRADFEKGLRIAREQLVRLAAILAELEGRGEAVDGNAHLLKMLRRIASGQLLPEVVVTFADSPATMERVSRLDVDGQRAALADPEGEKKAVRERRKDKPAVSRQPAVGSLAGMVAEALPADVAEMCLEAIRASSDPQAVAERMIPELQRIKNAPRPKKSLVFDR